MSLPSRPEQSTLAKQETSAHPPAPQAQFWLLWESLSDAVVVIDEHSIVRYANPALREVFGHERDAVIDRPLAMLQPEALRDAHGQGLARYVQSGTRKLNWRSAQAVGLHADGHEFPLEVSFSEIQVDGQRMFAATLRDISVRQRAEEELKTAVSQLTATLEATNEGIVVVGSRNRITRFNQRFAEMWNIPREVLDRHDDEGAMHIIVDQLGDSSIFTQAITRIRADPMSESFLVLPFQDGRMYEVFSRPQIDEGKAIGRVWGFRDVTSRVRADALQAALFKISEAAHSARDLVSLFPRIHEIISELLPARNLYVALYDETTDLISFPYFIDEFDSQPEPFTLKQSRGLTAVVVRSGEPLLLIPETSMELVPDPGSQFLGTAGVDWLGVPLKTPRGTIGVLTVQSYSGSTRYTERDKDLLRFVSDQVAAAVERKQVEQSVRESEERFRSVFDQSPMIICLLSYPDGEFLEMNAAGIEAFGFARDEIVGRTASELGVWVDISAENRYMHLLKTVGAVKNFEARMRRRSGEIFTTLNSGSVVTLGGREYSLNSLQDISERKLAEAALQESEEQFKSSFENSAIGMALVGLDGRFLNVNSCLCAIVGYSKEELLRRRFQDITHPDDVDLDLEQLKALLAGETDGYNIEKRYLHRNGGVVLVLLVVSVVKDKSGKPRHFISQMEDITERKRAEQWQKHYSSTLALIMAEAPIKAVLESLVVFAEQQAEGTLCSILLLLSDGKRLGNIVAPSLPAFYNKAIEGAEIGPDRGSCGAAAALGTIIVTEDILTDSRWTPWRDLAQRAGLRSCWSHPILSAENKVLGTFAIYRREPSKPKPSDLDLIRQSAGLAAIALERAQHHEDRRLAKVVFEQSVEGIMVTDLEDRVLMVNQSFESLTGYSSAEVVGHPPRLVDTGRDDNELQAIRKESMASSGRWRGELWGRKKSGDVYPLAMSVATVYDATGVPSHFISIINDVSEQKIQAARIEQLAFYDSLTGLPNRALFLDRLEQTLTACKRHGGQGAILFLDLDRFKEINDSQGHAVGDMALVEVARRFQTASRKEETLARLGGDEFVLIAENADRQTAIRIATRMQRALEIPLDLMGHSYTVGASIGIAFYPADGQTSEDLIKRTDIAMYRAKASGGGYRLYQAEMGAELEKRLTLAKRLALAMEAGGLQLYYQPQMALVSGRLIGAEALVRWNDSTLGWVSPSEFIPIAEERGMMGALGDWVLREACRQINAWAEQGAQLGGRLAINVSALQMEDPDIVGRLLNIVHEAGLRPERFELELTESSMMADPERAVEVMELLNAAGFGLSIDDFGTGYSSLAYLKRFAADQIKIDISFVRNMLTDVNDATIVTTIIAMARSLGLKTTAEGVEEAGQAAALLALGCDFAQGYHFGHPEPAASFLEKWLKPSTTA